MSSLERLWLAAWIEGLEQRTPEPAVRPVAARSRYVPLTDTGSGNYVRLRLTERQQP